MKRQFFKYCLLACTCLLLVACNSAVDKESDGVTIHLKKPQADGAKTIRLQVVNDNVIHVLASPTDTISTNTKTLATLTKGMESGWSYSSSDDDVILKTATLIVKILFSNGAITFMDKDRRTILTDQKDGGKSFEKAVRQVFESPDDDLFFGTLPFIVSNKNYGILWDNVSESTFENPRTAHKHTPEANKLAFQSSQGSLGYYFVYGSTMDQLVGGYRTVTGKAQIMPKWAMGLWQSREPSQDNALSYTSQDQLLGVVKEFRERLFPLDNIVLTGAYNKENFPDATAMIEEIHDYNAHFAIAVHFPKDQPANEKTGNGIWKQLDKNLFAKGVDAWWLNDSGNAVAAKSIYKGQRTTDNYHRVVIFDGSEAPALQNYSVITHTDSTKSRWEDLKNVIVTGLNFSVSGTPYWTTDIGGLTPEKRYVDAQEGDANLEEFRELYTRWHQFSTFTPIFLANGKFPNREPWNIAPTWHNAYSSMYYYTMLRYRLMPYIYSLAGKSHFEDYTMMRPLVMDFGKDKDVLNLSDQYMFGPALMVCPMYQYKTVRREVYFPQGQPWYDLNSGRYIEGGQKIPVYAPYDRIPVFVKAGSILPVGDPVQSTKDIQKNLTVFVYDGADGQFSLYEDENINYNYLKGRYTQIPFTYTNGTKKVTIGARAGEFQGMVRKRTITVVLITRGKGLSIDWALEGNVRTIVYDGAAQTISFAADPTPEEPAEGEGVEGEPQETTLSSIELEQKAAYEKSKQLAEAGSARTDDNVNASNSQKTTKNTKANAKNGKRSRRR
ncbi:MAG: glycoside hydrolase family 31 protein [Candidatus Symbiothrix sp.]|jgi:alpha-glucosidase (family GH31 glycosyl hydrolase)|nr:glycoside hydrolase family 31 protein [Candidatus Symbiothrix sp.]